MLVYNNSTCFCHSIYKTYGLCLRTRKKQVATWMFTFKRRNFIQTCKQLMSACNFIVLLSNAFEPFNARAHVIIELWRHSVCFHRHLRAKGGKPAEKEVTEYPGRLSREEIEKLASGCERVEVIRSCWYFYENWFKSTNCLLRKDALLWSQDLKCDSYLFV